MANKGFIAGRDFIAPSEFNVHGAVNGQGVDGEACETGARGYWRDADMTTSKSVGDLCRDQEIDCGQLAERTGMDEQKLLAIMMGRWTPSPAERDKVAVALGVSKKEIAWGHKTPIQHIYGHGPS